MAASQAFANDRFVDRSALGRSVFPKKCSIDRRRKFPKEQAGNQIHKAGFYSRSVGMPPLTWSTQKRGEKRLMHNIFYIIGVIVVIVAILSFLGLT